MKYLLAAVLFVLLFAGGPQYVDSRLFEEMWNLGHIVAFGLWTYLLLAKTPLRLWSWKKQAAAALSLAVLAGAFTEWLQVSFHRTPDIGDLLRDVLGAGIALAWFGPGRPKKRILTSFRGALVLGTFLALVPVGLAALDEVETFHKFPLLEDFENQRDLNKWEGKANISLSSEHVSHGKKSLRLDLDTTRYSGVYSREFPGDWSSWQFLNFSVYNPSKKKMELHVRIDDRKHRNSDKGYGDRYDGSFQVLPGWNHLRIHLSDVAQAAQGRRMAMDQIDLLAFFAIQLPAPRTIFLDEIRLE